MLNKLLGLSGTLNSALGSAIGMSDDQRAFLGNGYRCGGCGARLLSAIGMLKVRFLAADGHALSQWAAGALRADTAECQLCGHRWKIYGAAPTARTSPASAATVELVETERSEEFLGEDRRIIDNAMSAGTSIRRFTFSKEWSKTYQIEAERARSNGGEITLGAKDVAALRLSAEQKLRQTYSMSESSKEMTTEDVTCEVPAHRKVTVVVRWKRIWQHGAVRTVSDGAVMQVPFRVAVGVTFDQQQIDDG